MDDMFDLLSGEAMEDTYEPANPDLRLLDIPDGGEFMVGDYCFVKLGFEQGGILAILKDSFFRQTFNENRDNNYRNSEVRTRLNTEFLPILEADGVELLPYTIKLTEDTCLHLLSGFVRKRNSECRTETHRVLDEQLYVFYG